MYLENLPFEEQLAAAISLHEQGSWVEAEAHYRRLSTLNTTHPRLLALYGVLNLQMGNMSEGIERLQRSLELDSTQPLAHFNLGLAYRAERNLLQAVSCLRTAVELEPKALPYWNELLTVAGDLGDWRLKIFCLQALPEHLPDLLEQCRVALFSYVCLLMNEKIAAAGEILNAILESPTANRESILVLWTRIKAFQPADTPPEAPISPVRGVAADKLSSLDCLLLALILRHCLDMKWPVSAIKTLQVFYTNHLREIVSDNSIGIMEKNSVLNLLAYNISSPAEWNAFIFDTLIVPTLADWPSEAGFLIAIAFETFTAFSYAQQPHTEDQAKRCFERLAPSFARVGATFKVGKPKALSKRNVPVVAFISNLTVNGCSPDKVVIQIIHGLNANVPEFVPVLVAFEGVDKERVDITNMAVIDLRAIRDAQGFSDTFENCLSALHQELQRLGVTVLVFYNCTDGFSIAVASARLAPVQIFYSLGYHYMHGSIWDGLFAVGATGETRRIYNGRPWHTVELAHPDPYSGQSGQERFIRGQNIKAKYADAVVLGTICRPQKLDSDPFIDTLAKLLLANPETVFLWFGKEELPSVRKKMLLRGISERCHFQGWVDTLSYANVLDVHLDSFPFPTGLTMFDTMSAGCAAVFMDTPEARDTGIVSHMAPLMWRKAGEKWQQDLVHSIFTHGKTDESLFLLADDVETYLAYAQRLVADRDFLKAVGFAYQRFMREFKNDGRVMTRSFTRALKDVIGRRV